VPLGWLVAGTALVALAVTIVIITVRWLAVRLDPPARRPGQVL
jgi:choline-glycine betaine transporter